MSRQRLPGGGWLELSPPQPAPELFITTDGKRLDVGEFVHRLRLDSRMAYTGPIERHRQPKREPVVKPPKVERQPRSTCPNNHDLTGENVTHYAGDGPNRRRCRECLRISKRDYKQRRRAKAAA